MCVSIQQKIDFLQQPASYPDYPENVEMVETHHSVVFLTDRYAYKLKKPVVNDFHDYSTVENRHANSLAELRLNRRLAEEIYLAVVPLMREEKGRLCLEGKGKIVDWLVKMKRIPAENMLDHAIRAGTVTIWEVDRAAIRLAGFYKNALPAEMHYEAHLHQLATEIQNSVEVLSDPLLDLRPTGVEEVRSNLCHFLSAYRPVFRERVAAGRIIEGHGDLRPEHICLRPKPFFIDCLEFSEVLRTLDPVDDLAYLSFGCDSLDAAYIGERFLQVYATVAGDRFPAELSRFYKALRAFVKARLAAAHLLESRYKDDRRWMEKAEAYLVYARDHTLALSF